MCVCGFFFGFFHFFNFFFQKFKICNFLFFLLHQLLLQKMVNHPSLVFLFNTLLNIFGLIAIICIFLLRINYTASQGISQ